MPDFSKGKIYIIKHRTIPEHTYIGSTTADLSVRFSGHKTTARTGPSKIYTYMRENCISAFYIELLENYPCNTVNELRLREQYYKDLLKPTLNQNDACTGLTMKNYSSKYYNKHRNHYAELRREHRENNRDAYNKNHRKYYNSNKNVKKIVCEYCEKEIYKYYYGTHAKRCMISPKHWKAVQDYEKYNI